MARARAKSEMDADCIELNKGRVQIAALVSAQQAPTTPEIGTGMLVGRL